MVVEVDPFVQRQARFLGGWVCTRRAVCVVVVEFFTCALQYMGLPKKHTHTENRKGKKKDTAQFRFFSV